MPAFLLMRHGQSQANLEDRFEGCADFPLTELGRCQARLAADYLILHWQPTFIISSPLQRATQTAHAIADALGLQVLLNPNLREWNKGVLDGMLRSEALKKYPPPAQPRGVDDPIQDGESARQVYERAQRFWETLIARCSPEERVLIISHGGLLTMLYHVFLRLPLTQEVVFPTGDTGMHLWELRDSQRIVHWANRQEHLPFSLRY